MAAELTRLTHKIAIQLHLVAESCIICSSRSRRPVRKLLDTPSYYNLWALYEEQANLRYVPKPKQFPIVSRVTSEIMVMLLIRKSYGLK
jgi:hypothetical protein